MLTFHLAASPLLLRRDEIEHAVVTFRQCQHLRRRDVHHGEPESEAALAGETGVAFVSLITLVSLEAEITPVALLTLVAFLALVALLAEVTLIAFVAFVAFVSPIS